MEESPYYLTILLGIMLIIVVLMRHLGQRNRKNAQRQRDREVALRATQEAERKKQMADGLPKSKVILPKTRTPLGDHFGTPFTGNMHGFAAKWETEIHQIGRQIVGQIDSKMAALQAIALEANRTASRLEILVEHLEHIAQKQIERQQNQHSQHANADPTQGSPTVIAGTPPASEATPLTEILQELADDLGSIRKAVMQLPTLTEPVKPATILRLSELQKETSVTPINNSPPNIRGEVEMLANYGIPPKDIAHRLNLSLGEVDLMLQVQQNR